MRVTTMLMCLAAMTMLAGACCGSGDALEEFQEASAEAAAEAVADAAAEAAEPADTASDGGGGGPCGAYAKCCNDYADSLSKLTGYPADAVQAQKDSCDAVKALEGTPGGGDACKTSMDALVEGMAAMSAYPDWKKPDSCNK